MLLATLKHHLKQPGRPSDPSPSPFSAARILGLFVTLAWFCAPLALNAQSQNPEAWLEQGKQLAAKGELSQALLLFDRYKQTAPKDARPYIHAGRALLEAGRKEDALNELQQIRDMKLQNPHLAYLYAEALKLGGWQKEALRILTSFEEDPELGADGLWLLSDLYYQEHLGPESLRVLERYAKKRPGEPRTEVRRGEIHMLTEDYASALEAFQKAVTADPANATARYGLGRAVWLVHGTEDSKEHLLKAIELEPDNPNYFQTLGIICDRLGQTQEAIRHLEQATQLSDVPPQVFYDLGNIYRKAGDASRTREVLTEYRERFTAAETRKNREQRIEQLLNQGTQQLESNDVPAALATFERVLEVAPDNWQAHNFMAKIYLSSPRKSLALPHLDAMLKLEPENSEGSFLAAFYHYHQKHLPQALSHAERSKELLPGNPELRNLLGNIYLALGQRDEALAEYQAAVSLDPENLAFKLNYESVARQF